MRFKPTSSSAFPGKRTGAGFTLAEVLAALTFMAVVIPVAVQGLRIANLAGQVAERKAVAARLADRLLNEQVVSSQAQGGAQNGLVQEGSQQYRWETRNEAWTMGAVRLVSVRVTFDAQGRPYDVSLSTLLEGSEQ